MAGARNGFQNHCVLMFCARSRSERESERKCLKYRKQSNKQTLCFEADIWTQWLTNWEPDWKVEQTDCSWINTRGTLSSWHIWVTFHRAKLAADLFLLFHSAGSECERKLAWLNNKVGCVALCGNGKLRETLEHVWKHLSYTREGAESPPGSWWVWLLTW